MAHPGGDPFGTAALAAATLAAWRDSPTRLAEDHAAEADLAAVGYRDRAVVELVTNAADAAAAAGVDGAVNLWVRGRSVHIANTGAPLTAAGVRSLLALRVSAKTAGATGVVGRFGVGFTATAALAGRVEIRSTSGSIVFDADRARAAVRAAGIAADTVPLLRLAWPAEAAPAAGYATEIVLDLVPGIDADALLAAARAEAPGLLLALPVLVRIAVADDVFAISRVTDAAGSGELTVTGPAGAPQVWTVRAAADVRWLIRRRGEQVVPESAGVLWAPTPTDVALSVPARLVAALPLTTDRRHLHPDADIAGAAAGYVELLLAVADPAARLSLVPAPHRARSADDLRLTSAILDRLRGASWLPGCGGDALVPARASVLVGLSDELAAVLADTFADLVHPALSLASHIGVLERLGVTRLGLAGLAERLGGVWRDPLWWHRLYSALAPLVATGTDAHELAALPIPRADGRTNIGARGLFSAAAIATPLRWVRTVDPIADHPLLARLGVTPITVAEALSDPELHGLVAAAVDEIDDPVGLDVEGLADEVLALLAADPHAAVPGWLTRLPLPADDGDRQCADELLLRSSPLAEVLVADHPFAFVAADLADRFGADVLRRVGVGWGFAVLADDLPVAADHDLPDEQRWWDTRPEPPRTLCAVRDLDLVDPDRWPAALGLLAADAAALAALADRDGYTAWWLRTFAEVDGSVLGTYRAPADDDLAGVLDVLDHADADVLAPALAALPPTTVAEAALLIDCLGMPSRVISPGVARRVYTAVAEACLRGSVDWADIPAPDGARAVSGETYGCVVLDAPWWVQVLDPDDVVVGPADPDGAAMLADILDLPLASDHYTARVADPGEPAPTTCTDAVLFAAETGREPGRGTVYLHDELWILLRSGTAPSDITGVADRVRVRWWTDPRGAIHLARR
ncbi:MAG: hypothetical protein QM662_03855 [Gordonia sp. (in: high G+C Gram-positive bacteria)]